VSVPIAVSRVGATNPSKGPEVKHPQEGSRRGFLSVVDVMFRLILQGRSDLFINVSQAQKFRERE